MAIQERNQEMVELLSADFVRNQAPGSILADVGGWRVVSRADIGATAVVLLPDGANNVLYRLRANYVLRLSSGAVGGGAADVNNNANANIYDSGGETYNLRVNADGSVDIRRTAGSTTARMIAELIWL